MKAFWRYWQSFHRDRLPTALYVGVGLWLVILFVFNYTLDFEDSVIDTYAGSPVRWLWYILYNGLGYFGSLAVVYYLYHKQLRLSAKFWVLIILGILILTFDRSAYRYLGWIRDWFPIELFRLHYRTVSNAQSLVTILLLLFFVLQWDRPKENIGFYGLKSKGVNFRLYGLLFLLMIPIIGLACLLPDIQEYYPVYARAGGNKWAGYLGISEVWAVLLFELSYLLDFISVELFFRGFLVIGLSRYLGKSALLPMVTLYAMLHFGKPIGEAISSVFGGYILGVLAYETRNIYGGIVLNGGIALLMEVFAYIW